MKEDWKTYALGGKKTIPEAGDACALLNIAADADEHGPKFALPPEKTQVGPGLVRRGSTAATRSTETGSSKERR